VAPADRPVSPWVGFAGVGRVSQPSAYPFTAAAPLWCGTKVKMPNRDNFITRFPDRI
jgi:hypothetical protein